MALKDAPRKWFILYADLVSDPSVQMLAPDLFKFWINLLSIARQPDGFIDTSNTDVDCWRLRVAHDVFMSNLAELANAGFIVEANGGFAIRDAEKYYPSINPMRAEWSKVRLKLTPLVMEKHGAFCHYCGSIIDLTIDHVVPIAAGGSNDLDNLVVACRTCNCSKGAKTLEDWLQQ